MNLKRSRENGRQRDGGKGWNKRNDEREQVNVAHSLIPLQDFD